MIHFNSFFSPKSQPGNTTKEAFEGPVEGCTVGSGLEKVTWFYGEVRTSLQIPASTLPSF